MLSVSVFMLSVAIARVLCWISLLWVSLCWISLCWVCWRLNKPYFSAFSHFFTGKMWQGSGLSVPGQAGIDESRILLEQHFRSQSKLLHHTCGQCYKCGMNDRISMSCENASSANFKVVAECFVIQETFSLMLKRRKCLCGLYYKHTMIIIDAASVVSKWCSKL